MTAVQATTGPAGDSGAGPLAGILVVELANFISAPFATMMLSDLGADVVKVEPPKGDPFRRFGRSGHALSPLFVNTNRGKRGVALDLKEESDCDRLRELLATADVVVSNWRPGVAERLGLADADLTGLNARLIRIYVTGFGDSGPLSERPVYDAIVQAHLGSAQTSPPFLAPSNAVDKTAAAMVAQAALAALLARERHGTAERVDVSLLDAAAYLHYPDIMARRTYVDDAPADAQNRQLTAARPLQAADGWLVVVPVTADQIRRAFQVVGRADRLDEVLSIKDAGDLTARMMEELEQATKGATVGHWLKAFEAGDVPAGACLTIDQHLADEQVAHNHLYDVVEWPGLGRVRRIRYPARFSSWNELWPAAPPPHLERTGGARS